jgi:dTDP-4-amino-4,6-dideoxygalactose transaminase
LREIAAKHSLYVVEDAAHAVGSCYDGTPIGSGSDAVAFSFYATKNMTSAEGGMVTTPHQHLDERMRLLSLHGIDSGAWARHTKRRASWQYEVIESGFKYNLSDLHAAVGLAQLRKLDGFVAAQRSLAHFYHSRFRDVEEIALPAGTDDPGHSWHLYSLRLRLEKLRIDRNEFIEELTRRGIGSSVHFIPIPLHRAFDSLTGDARRALELYPRLLSIPIYPALREQEAESVAAAVIDIARSNRLTPRFFASGKLHPVGD